MTEHAPKQKKQKKQTRQAVPEATKTAEEPEIAELIQQAQTNPASLNADNVTQLQRAIGNQAVIQLMRMDRMHGVSAAVLQRAFDPDTPSTYDDDGGHSYADHGAQTTKEQHATRLTTGATPSGRNSKPPDGKSSKFASAEMHVKAMKMALADLNANKKNKRGRWKKGHSNTYNLANVGISYQVNDAGDGVKDETLPCNTFYAAWSNDGNGDNFKLITMWPKP